MVCSRSCSGRRKRENNMSLLEASNFKVTQASCTCVSDHFCLTGRPPYAFVHATDRPTLLDSLTRPTNPTGKIFDGTRAGRPPTSPERPDPRSCETEAPRCLAPRLTVPAVASCDEILVKVLFNCKPSELTTVMMTTDIPAAIKPYSMAVAPDSSFAKRFKKSNMCAPVPPLRRCRTQGDQGAAILVPADCI
jgi:hypothetical protein